jgi:TrmH family RNA methyltransferase
VPDITSTTNPKVKAVRELHRSKGRSRTGQTLVEGPKVFREFVDAGLAPSMVLVGPNDTTTVEVCAEQGLVYFSVSDVVLRAASDTVAAQSPVAVFPKPEAPSLRARNTVVLVDVADPGNVGTIIRSAAAFGWDVAYTPATADPWSPKTIRSGAGAHVRTRLIPVEDPVTPFDASEHRTVATVVGGEANPTPREGLVSLLIGSEAHGLPSAVVGQVHESISIPMVEGTESLNAAIAASIAMYALSGGG